VCQLYDVVKSLVKVRHSSLIPWDHDADVGVLESDKHKINGLKQFFMKEGFVLINRQVILFIRMSSLIMVCIL